MKNKKKKNKNPFDSYMKKYHTGGTVSHNKPHTDDPYTTDPVNQTSGKNKVSSMFAWGNTNTPDFSDQTKTNSFQGEIDPMQTMEGGATEDTGWMSMFGNTSGSGGGGMDTAAMINAATGATTETMGQIAGLIQLASQKYGDDPILTQTTNRQFKHGGFLDPNMFALGGMMGNEKAELEGGEGIVGLDGSFRKVKGKSHEQGGEIYDVIPQDQPFTNDKQVKPGEEIFSDEIKISTAEKKASESAAKREESRFKQEEKSKENYENNPNIFSKASLDKTILNRQIGGELDKQIQKDVREGEQAKEAANQLLRDFLKMNEVTSKFSESKKKSKKDTKYKKGGKVGYKYENGGKVKGKENVDIYKVPDLKLDLHKQQDNVKSNDNAKLNLTPGALEGSLSYNNKGLSLEAKAKQDYINLLQEGKLKNPELGFSASYGNEMFDVSGNINTNLEDASGNISANVRPSDKFSAYTDINFNQDPSATLGVDWNVSDKLNLGASADFSNEGVNAKIKGDYQLNPNTNLNAYLNYGKGEEGKYEPTFGAGLNYTFDRNKETPNYVYKHGGMMDYMYKNGGKIPMYQNGGDIGWPNIWNQFGQNNQTMSDWIYAAEGNKQSEALLDMMAKNNIRTKNLTDSSNLQFLDGQVFSMASEDELSRKKYDPITMQPVDLGINVPSNFEQTYDPYPGLIEQELEEGELSGQKYDPITMEPIKLEGLNIPSDFEYTDPKLDLSKIQGTTDVKPVREKGISEFSEIDPIVTRKIKSRGYRTNEIDPITGKEIPLDIDPELLKAPVLNLTETEKEKSTKDLDAKEKSDFTIGDELGMLGTGIGGISPMLTTLMQQAATPKNKSFFETYMDRALGTMEGQKGFLGQQKAKALKDVRLASDTFNRDTRRNVRSINTLRALGQLSNAQEQKMIADVYSNYAQQMMGLTGQIAQMQSQQDMVKMQGREKADIANRQDLDAFFTNLNQDQRNLGTMLQKMGRDLNVKKSDQDFLSILPDLNKYGISMKETKGGGFEMFNSRTGKTATQAELDSAVNKVKQNKK